MEKTPERVRIEKVQLLPIAELIPEFKSVEKERIRIGNIEYEFPSPDALGEVLIGVFSQESERTDKDASIRMLTLNIGSNLVRELKEGRRCLIVAQRDAENEHASSHEMLLTRAKGAFAAAEEVLRSLLTRRERSMLKRGPPEPEVPGNIAQPEELVEGSEKKDKSTLH